MACFCLKLELCYKLGKIRTVTRICRPTPAYDLHNFRVLAFLWVHLFVWALALSNLVRHSSYWSTTRPLVVCTTETVRVSNAKRSIFKRHCSYRQVQTA